MTSFLRYRARLPLLVVAAVRADAMRCLGLVTLRAQVAGRRRERIVRAAFGASRLRMSTFWIWHLYDSRLLWSVFSAASRGSIHSGSHAHVLVFRLVPHCGHRPLQSSWQSGFIGSAR